jgi:hypothetical protein
LAPTEVEEVHQAQALLTEFDRLVQQPDQLEKSYAAANELRGFKLHLLRRLLCDQIGFHLTPTFLNHMVNEVDEYLRIISYLRQGKKPPLLHPLSHHLLWLPDAAGHAEGIDGNLDGTEKNWKEKCRQFIRQFESFYIKAVEMAGYLRTNLKHFPALSKLNQDVVLEMRIFQKFLQEMEELSLNKQILGTLSPLLADHMYREECYYLTKLSQVSKVVGSPQCNPFPTGER